MKFFLDTANLDEIREIAGWGILDGVTTNPSLCAKEKMKFDELIRELADTMGLTVFLITHDLDSLYATCDRVAVLAEKKVIAVGTIPELLATEHPWIQDYFNGPRGRAAAGGNQTAKRR